MEKRVKRPVHFHFKDHQEMIDLYIKIEFKFFLQKLLYTQYTRGV